MVLDWLIDIVGIYFSSGFAVYWLYPLIGIYVIASVPALIRYIASWR